MKTRASPEQLLQLATGFMASKMLFAASEAGIFSALSDGPKELTELANRISRPPRTTRILADALVALNVLARKGDRYRNGAAADAFLSGKDSADLRPFLKFWNAIAYPRWEHLEECVASGRPATGEFSLTAEQQKIFSEGVASVTSGTANALASTYDFSRHTKVLDLGGGTGSFLRAILERFADLRGTLYDRAQVVDVAKPHLRDLTERIDFVAGDFMRDAIPSGHDAIVAANIAHYFSPEGNEALLRRIREVVVPTARVLLVDWWMNADHTEPVAAALMSGEFLVNTGEGQSYSVDEARCWCDATGWRVLDHAPLEGPISLIVAEAAA